VVSPDSRRTRAASRASERVEAAIKFLLRRRVAGVNPSSPFTSTTQSVLELNVLSMFVIMTPLLLSTYSYMMARKCQALFCMSCEKEIVYA
jgi:hypothetical protein